MKGKGRTYTVTVLIALAGILVSLVVGCLAGGIAGYWISSRKGERWLRSYFKNSKNKRASSAPS
jgi:membrane protein DedA with SNARE-associated domain